MSVAVATKVSAPPAVAEVDLQRVGVRFDALEVGPEDELDHLELWQLGQDPVFLGPAADRLAALGADDDACHGRECFGTGQIGLYDFDARRIGNVRRKRVPVDHQPQAAHASDQPPDVCRGCGTRWMY